MGGFAKVFQKAHNELLSLDLGILLKVPQVIPIFFLIAILPSLFQAQIRPSIQRRGFSAVSHALFGPPKISRDLLAARDDVFCIAACKLQNRATCSSSVLKI